MESIFLSIAAFIGTNIDDMIINMVFFSSAKSSREVWCIVLGKYIGTGMLVLLSILASLGFSLLPIRYTGCLGLIPIALGVKEIIGNCREDGDDASQKGRSRSGKLIWNVALVTITNGADNMGVYTPLFVGFSVLQSAVFCAVFAWMIALWCVLGYRAARLPFLKSVADSNKKVIIPTTYILLGSYILLEGFF